MKSKLPFGKKPKADDDESQEIEENSASPDETEATSVAVNDDGTEEHEKPSLKDRVKSSLTSLTNLRKLKQGDEGFEKKKKISRILQVSIGLGVVVILLSDEIFPPDAETPEVPVTTLKKRPKVKVPVAEEKKTDPATETPATETPATDEKTTPTTTQTPAEPATETGDDSLVEVTSTEVPTEPGPAVTQSPTTETPTTEAPATETPTTETPATETPTTTSPTTEPGQTETPVTDVPTSEPTPDTAPVTTDTIDGTEPTPGGDETITDQILQDLEKQAKGTKPVEQKKEYVTPPDYEYRGRGLVYNCQGKHWACVDAPSFRTCEQNHSSVKYLGKKIECYPLSVYETLKGCENMQNRMVSSSAKTEFCN